MKTKNITVNVTQEDINNGTSGDYDRCPIALAIARELPGSDPSVSDEVHLLGEGYCGHACQPSEAEEFVISFDLGRPVSPLTFKLTFENFDSPTA